MPAGPTLHVRPTAELAERALLPGDPGRALALAQALLVEPRMFNHHRGLWGYTGAAGDGRPLTIQSTGMGGPSAAIVLEELAMLGLRRAVRVGTCGALAPELALGDLVIAREALCDDGTSRALGARDRAAADERLTALLERAAANGPWPGPPARAGLVASTDLFYDEEGSGGARWKSSGALAVEMEAATVFTLARRRGLAAGCLLVVSDRLDEGGGRERIDEEALLVAAESMGAVAVQALEAEPEVKPETSSAASAP